MVSRTEAQQAAAPNLQGRSGPSPWGSPGCGVGQGPADGLSWVGNSLCSKIQPGPVHRVKTLQDLARWKYFWVLVRCPQSWLLSSAQWCCPSSLLLWILRKTSSFPEIPRPDHSLSSDSILQCLIFEIYFASSRKKIQHSGIQSAITLLIATSRTEKAGPFSRTGHEPGAHGAAHDEEGSEAPEGSELSQCCLL